MNSSENNDLENCPIRKNLKIIGGKWSLLILLSLQEGPQRFGALRKRIPDISEKMLIQRLRSMELHGFLSRKDYRTNPPKVEYSLSSKGVKALDIVDVILSLERDY